MNIPVIGIASNGPGAGKSTAATALMIDVGPHNSAAVNFANPLKATAMAFVRAAGYSINEAADAVFHNKEAPLRRIPGKPTGRKLLQTLGTEWGRELIHPDLWAALWIKAACAKLEKGLLVVTDDVRRMNEVEAIRSLGGKLIYVQRPDMPQPAHASEGGIDPTTADLLVLNTGTAEELEEQVVTWWHAVAG